LLVKSSDVEELKKRLAIAAFVAVDTETFGLRPFHGDTPFSVIFALSGSESYYVPVMVSEGISENDIIDVSGWGSLFDKQLVFMQNAKFDLHHLATVGFTFAPQVRIHCTAVAARLCDSNLPSYSLDYLGKHFLKESKDDRVKAYVAEHDFCRTVIPATATARKSELQHYDKVPLDLIVPYGKQDTELTFKLGMEQLRILNLEAASVLAVDPTKPTCLAVLDNEYWVTRALEGMERRGVKLDTKKTKAAIDDARSELDWERNSYIEQTGEDYKASSKAFYRHLETSGADLSEVGKTECGNPSLDKQALGKIQSGIAKTIIAAKNAKTRLNYYDGFIRASDPKGFIHTDFKQFGTRTSRFSSAQPNLQNLKREDEETPDPASPRRLIIPSSPEFCFFLPDYDQMEYRMMLDYAGEMGVIAEVLAGADVHQATSNAVGIPRSKAKSLNFAIIYGGGEDCISEMLGIPTSEARALIRVFKSALPSVERFVATVQRVARTRHYTYNWFGRRNHYVGYDSKTHASVNHLIQGGCADVMKIGMVMCDEFLAGKKSNLRLSIHDELVFELHRSELYLAPVLLKIMEKAYPYNHLPLTVSPSHSWTSLGEKIKGFPI